MVLYLIGIDYKSAPISIRESVHKARNEIVDFWKNTGEEKAVLFTCNRIELYGASENVFQITDILDLFYSRFSALFERSYVRLGTRRVIEHMLRLSCGLESQVKGEEEVLAQLDSWVNEYSFPWILRNIWKEVLIRAEDIRIRSGIEEKSSNIAEIIFKRLIESRKKDIVIVGTGKIARLFSENKPAGINLHFVARKKHKRAKQLARWSEGKAVLLDDLRELLLRADAVISATSSPHYVLKKEHFVDITEKRIEPLDLYDLAMPRDIEPAVQNISGISLKNLDDLDQLFRGYAKTLEENIKSAESLIRQHSAELLEGRYEDSYKGRGASELISVETG